MTGFMTLSCFEHSLKQQLKIEVNLLVNRQVQLKQECKPRSQNNLYIARNVTDPFTRVQTTYIFFGVFNIQHRSGFTVAKARDSYGYF